MESKILNALGIDPAFIFLFMLILFVVLFILYVNVTMKYNRLKNSYATFMKGKDGKSLEQSLKDKFEEAEAVLKFTKQNRTEIRELNRKLETNYQKVGIVKYDAFNEMGGKLSFALAMLDGNPTNKNYAVILLATAVATLPILIIFLIFQKQFVAGVMGGAVKE